MKTPLVILLMAPALGFGVYKQRLQERPAWLVCVRFSAQRKGRAQLTKLIDDTKGQAASYRAPRSRALGKFE
jgi:hypothetical protein